MIFLTDYFGFVVAEVVMIMICFPQGPNFVLVVVAVDYNIHLTVDLNLNY